MANSTQITEVVGAEAYNQIQRLDGEMKKLGATYVSIVKTIGNGLDFKPQNLAELNQKTNDLSENTKKLQQAATDYNATAVQRAQVEKTLAEAARELARADLDRAKADNERVKTEKQAEAQAKKRNVSEKELTQIMNTQATSIKQAEEQNRRLRLAVKAVEGEDEKAYATRKRLNDIINQNTQFISRSSDAYIKQKMTIGDYAEQIKLAAVSIKNAEGGMKGMGQQLGIVAGGFGNIAKLKVGNIFNDVSTGVGTMIKGFVGAQGVLTAIRSFVGLIKDGVSTIIEFEKSTSKLAAILGTTKDGIKELESEAKRLGATTRYTASEVVYLETELAKLGFTRQEILNSTDAVLKFAQATDASLPEAAAMAGAALRAFGDDARNMERYVSVMAIATTKSALSFSYLQTAMATVSPVAKAFGFTIEDTMALLGKLADAGFNSSMAATATRNILLNLADAGGDLAKKLGAPVKTIPELSAALVKLRDSGVDLNETLELTDKRSVAAFNAFLTQAEGIVTLREQVTDVVDDFNKMAKTMNDNVFGSIKGLQSAWEAFVLTFQGSTGPMKDVLDFLARGIRNIAANMASDEQVLDRFSQQSIDLKKEQMKQFDIEGENVKRLTALYEEMTAGGMTAEEAEKKAKAAMLENKQTNLKAEQEYHDQQETEWKELQKLYNEQNNSLNVMDNIRSHSTRKRWEDIRDNIAISNAELYQMKAVIYALEGANLAPDATPTETGETEKQQKEREKKEKAMREQAKREADIERDIQQSRIALMDEGYEKERLKLEQTYQKREDEAKKSGIRVNEQLIAIEAEKIKRLSEFDRDYFEKREMTDVQNRISATEKGTVQELVLRKELLEKQRNAEIREAQKTGADVAAIKEKYNKQEDDLDTNYGISRITKQSETEQLYLENANKGREKEMLLLEEQFNKGLISQEKYESQRLAYAQESAVREIELQIQKAEALAEILPEDERVKELIRLDSLRRTLVNKNLEFQIASDKKEVDSQKKKYEEIIGIASQATEALAELGKALYEKQIQQVDEELEAEKENYDKKIARIDELVEKDVITTEEAEARKRVAQAETEQRTEELERKKAELQTKSAKLEKAANISQAIMNTAVAVMKAWGVLGPFGAPMAAIIAALGAVQLATIMATPIPKYAKGTDNHPGGLAIVGDGGKHEAIVSGGKTWITPDKPTLLPIPKGAKVLPDIDYSRFTTRVWELTNAGKSKDMTVVTHNNFDDGRMVETMSGVRREIALLNKTVRKQSNDMWYRKYKGLC